MAKTTKPREADGGPLSRAENKGFNYLLDVAKHSNPANRIALLRCMDSQTGKPVALIVSVMANPDGSSRLYPMALLLPNNKATMARYIPSGNPEVINP